LQLDDAVVGDINDVYVAGVGVDVGTYLLERAIDALPEVGSCVHV
jgi:hypothetical protein